MPKLVQLLYYAAIWIFAINVFATACAEPKTADADDKASQLAITNLTPGEFVLTASETTELNNIATIASMPDSADPLRARSTNRGMPFALSNSRGSDSTTACLTIPEERPIFTQRWNGFPCKQGCDKDARSRNFRTGTFRLLVSPCGSQNEQPVGGSAFIMPTKPDMLQRWRATSGVISATIFSLQPAARTDSVGDRLAGFLIAPNTARSLSPDAQEALLRWLRNEHGFANNVARRCRARQSYGFLLEQGFSRGFHGSTEIAVDLYCNTLVLKRFAPDGSIEEHYAVFDQLRQELIEIIDQAL